MWNIGSSFNIPSNINHQMLTNEPNINKIVLILSLFCWLINLVELTSRLGSLHRRTQNPSSAPLARASWAAPSRARAVSQAKSLFCSPTPACLSISTTMVPTVVISATRWLYQRLNQSISIVLESNWSILTRQYRPLHWTRTSWYRPKPVDNDHLY